MEALECWIACDNVIAKLLDRLIVWGPSTWASKSLFVPHAAKSASQPGLLSFPFLPLRRRSERLFSRGESLLHDASFHFFHTCMNAVNSTEHENIYQQSKCLDLDEIQDV